jgi:hypothetical protein
MRQKCVTCGDFKYCNDDTGECTDCLQDKLDLEEWLPENGYEDEETEEEDDVE